MTLDALATAYDHVIIDGGAVADIAAERFAQLAPKAVLVASDLNDPSTQAARERLQAAGFADITVLVGAPRGPEIDAPGARAALPENRFSKAPLPAQTPPRILQRVPHDR